MQGAGVRYGLRAARSAALYFLAALPLAKGAAASDHSGPPGMLVDIGARRIHIVCEGTGSPAVILDAGLGASAKEWATVQHRVASRTRVCAYDRAGYGWSDPGPLPRSSLAIAEDLREALRHAGMAPPFVLAGHSFGGFNVRVFANRFPQETAGLVLVDASNEHQVARLEDEAGIHTAPVPGRDFTLFSPQPAQDLPDSPSALARELERRYRTQRTAHAELAAFRLSATQVSRFHELPPVPLMVISRSAEPGGDGRGNPRMERSWQRMQDELLHLIHGGTQLISRHAGHSVQLEDPELVSKGISLVLDQVRGEAAPFHASLGD